MESVEIRLSEIGYRRERGEPECWSVMRFGAPAPAPAQTNPPAPAKRPQRREPARSRALATWLARLIDRNPRPSPYQVCLAMHMAGAESRLGRRPR